MTTAFSSSARWGEAAVAGQGPVSAVLEGELSEQLRTRGVLVWVDKDADYSAFVDALRARWLRGDYPYPVCGFRGSYLEVMLQLDGLVDGMNNRPLLIHLPGMNQDELKATPLLEYFRAGKRYQKKLSTLVEEAAAGKVEIDAIEAYVSAPDLSLAAADQWLSAELSQSHGILERLSLAELWSRLVEDVTLVGRQPLESSPEEIQQHLRKRLGISGGWGGAAGLSLDQPARLERRAHLRQLAEWMARWALAVEYVHDLVDRTPTHALLPVKNQLPGVLVQECSDFAEFLRQNQQTHYARVATEFEALIAEEVASARPQDLGKIDTFRFEERCYLRGALQALADGQWDRAGAWAGQRAAQQSFWLRQEPERAHAWQLVGVAAALGAAVDATPQPLTGAMSLAEASERYAESLWQVDQAHRIMEQLRATLLVPTLPEFGLLLKQLDALREYYHTWCDALARAFTELCEQHGFLPSDSLQQRYIFEQVVVPWTREARQRDQKVVLFMVDALRFEMAVSLKKSFDEMPGTKTQLKPRLAELPSVTAVGMNALAPVHRGGRLSPILKNDKFCGFKTAQFQVTTPDSRRRMMQHIVGGEWCPLLDLRDVVGREKELKKQIQKANLVVIHSSAIDEAGENGHGRLTFELTLRDIRSAMRVLREAGVKRFIITSDHGFLLPDSTRERLSHGKKTDPQSRWRLLERFEKNAQTTSVALSALGYEDAPGYLVLPRDARAFDTGGSLPDFVHGGNSPQERIIPLLTVTHAREVGGSTADYQLKIGVPDEKHPMQGINLRVERPQATLDLGGPNEVELALRVPDDPNIRVELHSIRDVGRIDAASVIVPIDQTVDVFFNLRGPEDGRCRVQIYSPTLGEQVEPVLSETWFNVQGQGKTRSTPPAQPAGLSERSAPVERADLGLDALPEDARKIFEHLAEYDAISEQEGAQLLGSPRKMRQFSRNFDEYLAKVSFDVYIEQTLQGKRYVRR